MGDYIHKCELCGKTFDLYNGEGWGESYMKEGAMLPSTRYVCMECIKKRKENGRMKEWSNKHIDAYNMTVKDWLSALTNDNWHTERMVVEAIIDGGYDTMGEALMIWLGHRTYGYMPDELVNLRNKVYDKMEKEEE